MKQTHYYSLGHLLGLFQIFPPAFDKAASAAGVKPHHWVDNIPYYTAAAGEAIGRELAKAGTAGSLARTPREKSVADSARRKTGRRAP